MRTTRAQSEASPSSFMALRAASAGADPLRGDSGCWGNRNPPGGVTRADVVGSLSGAVLAAAGGKQWGLPLSQSSAHWDEPRRGEVLPPAEDPGVPRCHLLAAPGGRLEPWSTEHDS